MTTILPPLRKQLPESIVKILGHVFDAAREMEIAAFLIGAMARDLIFEYVYDAGIRRATEDIDFGVAVETWNDYEGLRDSLLNTKKFRKDNKQEQRIWWIDSIPEMRIDLVPFGGVETPESTIAFPPTGDFTMSTLGFPEANGDLWLVDITENLRIEVASLPGVAMLKFIAYNDRPAQRHRDIQDIFFIAENYLEAGNEDRLYTSGEEDSDLLDDENFDYRTVGARLLGRDIAPLLNVETDKIICSMLNDESGGKSLYKLSDIVNNNRFQDLERERHTSAIFRELKRGIEEKRHTGNET